MATLSPFGGYVKVKVGVIPQAKLQRAFLGQAIRLSQKELTGDRVLVVHPNTATRLNAAKKSSKGTTTKLTHGEVNADIEYHDSVGAGIHGGSLWSWLRDKAYPWVKKNWNIIKPVVSKIADVAIPAAATYFGQPQAAAPLRQGLTAITGVGLKDDALRAWKYLKDNGHLSKLADELETRLIKASPENAEITRAVRSRVKSKYGIGLDASDSDSEEPKKSSKLTKGSQEMKDKMAALRAKRKNGGSFRAGSIQRD